ncbi:ABC transporter permease [Amycolatopsis sp. NPDC004378]
MNLLAVERIKLFSTRSPWWCALITLALTIGFAAVIALAAPADKSIDVLTTQYGGTIFGIAVIMVLAALAVTTEYRFNTIRTTFQAVPHRSPALVAKAVVVAVLGLVLGELAGFGAWALASAMRPNDDLALHTAQQWFSVAGLGPVFAFAGVLAVAVGVLLRHSAAAITLLLVYYLAAEDLVRLVPRVGDRINGWLPFTAAAKFLGSTSSTSVLSPAWALVYFAGISVFALMIALIIVKKRDA